MNCYVCNKVIPKERLEFLIENGVVDHHLTCVKHSQNAKIKGIYSGEVGTSDLILCDKIYNDSVRSVFRNQPEEEEEEEED